uniref:Uncharacterized protein n=1 Tax=Ditylum brightwellii TaxID=49249 RepID=A0A6V2LAU6_9STRA
MRHWKIISLTRFCSSLRRWLFFTVLLKSIMPSFEGETSWRYDFFFFFFPGSSLFSMIPSLKMCLKVKSTLMTQMHTKLNLPPSFQIRRSLGRHLQMIHNRTIPPAIPLIVLILRIARQIRPRIFMLQFKRPIAHPVGIPSFTGDDPIIAAISFAVFAKTGYFLLTRER